MGDYFSSLGAREGMVSEFETSLGLRLDYEACLAYLVSPPLGAILLLILERKSDYVRYVRFLGDVCFFGVLGHDRDADFDMFTRFHAWQSSLLFTALFVVHLLFSWSTFLSWLFFLGDLVLIAWLVFHAYRDADTLDRLLSPATALFTTNFADTLPDTKFRLLER